MIRRGDDFVIAMACCWVEVRNYKSVGVEGKLWVEVSQKEEEEKMMPLEKSI